MNIYANLLQAVDHIQFHLTCDADMHHRQTCCSGNGDLCGKIGVAKPITGVCSPWMSQSGMEPFDGKINHV